MKHTFPLLNYVYVMASHRRLPFLSLSLSLCLFCASPFLSPFLVLVSGAGAASRHTKSGDEDSAVAIGKADSDESLENRGPETRA